jgi:hypothetical protein
VEGRMEEAVTTWKGSRAGIARCREGRGRGAPLVAFSRARRRSPFPCARAVWGLDPSEEARESPPQVIRTEGKLARLKVLNGRKKSKTNE